jgi:TolB-like protein
MRRVYSILLAAKFVSIYTAFQTSLTPPLRAAESFAPDSATMTLAVLDFKNNSGLFAFDGLEKRVAEMLKTELSRPGSPLLVVERQKLETILQEQALGQTGVLDEKTAQAVGQLLGAQFLLTGEISTSESRLRIDCHILKTATGEVRSEKVIGPDQEDLDAMIDLLASNIRFNLTGEGAHRDRRRLKKYPVTWSLLATAVATAATGVTHWISHEAYRDYQSATRLDEIESRYNRAENFRKARNGLAIASGVLVMVSLNLWIKNHSEKNAIFAAAVPRQLQSTQMYTFWTPAGEIGVGLSWRF